MKALFVEVWGLEILDSDLRDDPCGLPGLLLEGDPEEVSDGETLLDLRLALDSSWLIDSFDACFSSFSDFERDAACSLSLLNLIVALVFRSLRGLPSSPFLHFLSVSSV